jgi:hypothetical protein
LTAALDVVDSNLLRKHFKILGIPVQLLLLLDDWLSERSAYSEVYKNYPEFWMFTLEQFKGQFKGQFSADGF